MRHIISILIENEPGALSRVVDLFSARAYNIETLTVAPTEDQSLSRMTISTKGSDDTIEQITKHLNRLVDVVKVVDLIEHPHIERELMLIKVKGANRTAVLELVEMFRARVVDVGSDTVTIEATGAREKLAALVELLAPHGIKEIVQSGVVALARGNRGMSDRTARGLEK